MANAVRRAVEDGEYASTSEVIQDALRLWELRRQLRERDLDVRLAPSPPRCRAKPACKPYRPNARLARPGANPLRRPNRRQQAASEALRQAVPP